MSPFLSFDRAEWAELRNSVPMTLSEDDLKALQGINENLTMEEAVEIYLPLSRLLNLYVQARQSRNSVLQQFLNTEEHAPPFVIGIAGSVAVGKSTTARILKALLSRWENHPKVALVTTDGFLYPKKVLEERGIMHRKGFPESYDIKRLVEFVSDVKAGKPNLEVPVYSHITYDITDELKKVDRPDVLIIEGLNVLQSGMDYPHDPHRVFVSDFLDFSIYVDAESETIEQWYVERFLKFRRGAFTKPGSYFSHYTQLSVDEAKSKAKEIWRNINGLNLELNILPTRERAHLILHKGANHLVDKVSLRK
ncbi:MULTISPECIES: type I pantothenate kinase [Vibrio]|jgi:type I pantothenate kinase|uniref:Pantothenate kinase n=19 Tax=Vibrionaceae TaxID=641 RepID=A0A0F5TPZ9_VIBPH|nr:MULTISPECIES: type I pantothenate kinase [Vibrio]EJG0767754.1 type I pantothenate kinase [Vibrio parahaemolyticus O5:K30]EJG0875525.1 type I pantothenate kinase [Vibrio parahaemolyticus O3]EJG0904186.1 type I pantothenate kinase [Vibrio parahaemolyticus O3:K56]EJG0923905.1 type I pantothenate kinase [Vibrio parahaemolyticus O1:K68]EJG0933553.1 type I pantothenate kinase [Vibrio parahaemolyticus O1]EJG0947739.1 type I pantothenate kinase [Vibrio parahaemolyticus O10]EJG1077031.1 type I pan